MPSYKICGELGASSMQAAGVRLNSPILIMESRASQLKKEEDKDNNKLTLGTPNWYRGSGNRWCTLGVNIGGEKGSVQIGINIRKRSSNLDEYMRGIMRGGLLTVFAQVVVGTVSVVLEK